MVIVVEKVADVGVVDAGEQGEDIQGGLRPPAGHDSSADHAARSNRNRDIACNCVYVTS